VTSQTTVNNVVPEVIGSCATFEEKQVGGERFNLFKGCPCAQTSTIVLRGGAEQFIAEVSESERQRQRERGGPPVPTLMLHSC